jgi:hypothetical protein
MALASRAQPADSNRSGTKEKRERRFLRMPEGQGSHATTAMALSARLHTAPTCPAPRAISFR